MKKTRIEKLIPIANRLLVEQYTAVYEQYKNADKNLPSDERKKILDNALLRKDSEETPYYIKSNYDGKVSALGVTVALSGLLPALAMYYNDSGEVKTRPILELIAKIIFEDKEYSLPAEPATAQRLLEHALNLGKDNLDNLKKYILEASIALKQIVRTYDLKK